MESKNKFWIGVLFLLTGCFLGLIAGLLLYKPETEERETFIKGCKALAWVEVGLIALMGIMLPIIIFIF